MSNEVFEGGLMTSREAAEFLRISERKLWSLAQAGDIACVRIGRAVRYTRDALNAFISQQMNRKNS